MSVILPCTPKIPHDWSYMSLSDLVKEVIDNRGKTAPTSEEGIPLIATNCIKNDYLFPRFIKIRFVSEETYENWFRGHPEPGDIIFVNKGTPGLTCLVPDPVNFCFAQDMVALRADENKIYPKYLFAALRSPFLQAQVKANIVGTLIPHLKKSDFNRLMIPIPPKDAQKRIGDIYYELSLKIHFNREMNQILEKISQSIFKSWFVDFEPFQESKFVESELGKIPQGWGIDNLKNFTNITMGLSPPGESYNENGAGMPFFQGTKDFGTRYPKNRVYTIQPKRIAYSKDILLSVRAPVGSLNIAIETCCIGRGLASMRMKNNHGGFLYYLLKSQMYRLKNSGGGTVFSAIRKVDIESFRLIKPPIDLIKKFNELVESLDDKFEFNVKENKSLREIRNTLLLQLISGKLRIPSPKKSLEELESVT